MHAIRGIILGRSGYGQKGICSVCSASEYVIEAAIRRAKETGTIALIECTVNQVNQFGGYTSQRPRDFADKVFAIADRLRIDRAQVVLGGDHLGPFPWRGEDEDSAMSKSEDLVAGYVAAGFTKIHIDTSMRLGNDSELDDLSDETIAARAARLAQAVKRSKLPGLEYAFVLGSEVPVPGGTGETAEDAAIMSEITKTKRPLCVTTPDTFLKSYDCFREIFSRNGLEDIWQDVVAFVVQPGVEFGENHLDFYDRNKARELCGVLSHHPNICFEGHSTDYQPKTLLREMVEDGIKILKVGPALTFYQREAIFALEMIERELLGANAESNGKGLSNFAETLESVMLEDPSHWENYYIGDESQQRLKRRFSLSDRSRYYFSQTGIVDSLNTLIKNLNSTEIPYSLLSQYMPIQAELIKSDIIKPDAESLIVSRITDCLDDYIYAIRNEK